MSLDLMRRLLVLVLAAGFLTREVTGAVSLTLLFGTDTPLWTAQYVVRAVLAVALAFWAATGRRPRAAAVTLLLFLVSRTVSNALDDDRNPAEHVLHLLTIAGFVLVADRTLRRLRAAPSARTLVHPESILLVGLGFGALSATEIAVVEGPFRTTLVALAWWTWNAPATPAGAAPSLPAGPTPPELPRGVAGVALRVALVVVPVVLAHRLLLGGMRAARDLVLGTEPAGILLLVPTVAAASALLFLALGLLRRDPPRLRALTLALAAVPLAGLLAAHVQAAHVEVQRLPSDPPRRELGHFPYAGDADVPITREDDGPTTHTLPDGSRTCGPTAGTRTLAFVGDSFVFGQAVPDEDTLCWLVREALGAEAADWRLVNLGQKGANLRSVVEAARFARDVHHADVLVVSTLAADDTRPFDLNSVDQVSRLKWFRAVAHLSDPRVLLDLVQLLPEAAPPDFYTRLVTNRLLDELIDAVATPETPLVLELIGPMDSLGRLRPLVAPTLARAAAHPDVAFVEPADFQPVPPEGWLIPGDGHPNRAGHLARTERLLPLIREAMARHRATEGP